MPAVKIRDEGRIERLVSLAYILSTRSEIHIDELTERLGISKNQLESDINVLMFCGLPPYSPEQLFDIIIEDEFVSIYFNDVFVSPLRLTKEEVTQILIALRRLESSATGRELEIVTSTIEAIDINESNAVVVDVAPSSFDQNLIDAISKSNAVEMTYLSLNSASISSRIVFPKKIFSTASTSYLFALDQNSNDLRVFRTDRILELNPRSDLEYKMHSEQDMDQIEKVSDTGIVFIEQKDDYVDLTVNSEATWLLDSYPNELIDSENSIYRFSAPTAFFAARLLFANYKNVELAGGTFSKEAILEAMERISGSMANILNGKG